MRCYPLSSSMSVWFTNFLPSILLSKNLSPFFPLGGMLCSYSFYLRDSEEIEEMPHDKSHLQPNVVERIKFFADCSFAAVFYDYCDEVPQQFVNIN